MPISVRDVLRVITQVQRADRLPTNAAVLLIELQDKLKQDYPDRDHPLTQWEYNLERLPREPGFRFLGLYHSRQQQPTVARIIWRAERTIKTLGYLTDHGSVSYYVHAPNAYALLPPIQERKT